MEPRSRNSSTARQALLAAMRGRASGGNAKTQTGRTDDGTDENNRKHRQKTLAMQEPPTDAIEQIKALLRCCPSDQTLAGSAKPPFQPTRKLREEAAIRLELRYVCARIHVSILFRAARSMKMVDLTNLDCCGWSDVQTPELTATASSGSVEKLALHAANTAPNWSTRFVLART